MGPLFVRIARIALFQSPGCQRNASFQQIDHSRAVPGEEALARRRNDDVPIAALSGWNRLIAGNKASVAGYSNLPIFRTAGMSRAASASMKRTKSG